MRHLATVQHITNLRPIPDADRIEVADILGWHVVVKKGEFKVGDMVVYCEIDSILPDRPEFDFLKNKNGEMGKIKTIKLRKQISQGIAFPMSILPDGSYAEGDDVTEILGIRKYEPIIPLNMQGKQLGSFPSWVPKTDETRIQTCCDEMRQDRYSEWYLTEKLDGTSATYAIDPHTDEFVICSHNIRLDPNYDSVYTRIADKYDIEHRLRLRQQDVAIQGEIIGPKIQGNKYGLAEPDFYVFRMYSIPFGRFFSEGQMLILTGMDGLKTVPIFDKKPIYLSDFTVDNLIDKAMRRSNLADIQCEGIVYVREDSTEALDRVSFKAINPQFLLKYGE